MAYEGFLSFGGNEVINSPRAEGITRSADCAVNSIVGESCPTLADALGHAPYAFWNIQDAPWYDPDLPELSSKVYGVYGLGLTGLQDSTRETTVTEGLADGGVIGMTRRAVREIRARFQVFAKGQEAADYAMGWLDAALSPDACGQHGTDCGTTDVEFLAECPPERATVRDYGEWSETARNLFTNPSFEAGSGTVVVRRNLASQPAPQTIGSGDGTWNGNGAAGGSTSSIVAAPSHLQALGVPTVMRRSGGQPANAYRMGANIYGLTIGTTYTFSLWGQHSHLPTFLRLYTDSSGSYDVTSSEGLAPGEAGWLSVTFTATQDNYRLYMVQVGTPTADVTWDVSAALVEEGTVAGTWFSGSAQPRVRTNYLSTPIFSTGGGLNFRAGGTTDGGSVAGVGRSVNVTSSLGSNAYLVTTPPTSAFVSGDPVSMSVTVRNDGTSAITLRVAAYLSGSNVSIFGETTTIPPGETADLLMLGQATPDGTTSVSPRILVGPSSSVGPGDKFTVFDGWTIEKAATPGTRFTGDSGAPRGFATAWTGAPNASSSFMYDSDFSVAWTGAENASESILTGTAPQSPTGGHVINNGCAAVLTTGEGVLSGTKALRIIPTSSSTQTFYQISGYNLALFKPGKTYTALASVTLPAPLSGTLSVRALSLNALDSINPGSNASAVAPNTAGTHHLRVTFTVPSGATFAILRLWNGATAGGGDVIWDDVAIVEGVYDGPWFSGDSPAEYDEQGGPLVRYSWAGAANASDSIQESRTFTDRPQNDIEYAATVDGLRRYLHDAAVTSGPTIVSERVRDGIVYRVVEFTISVGRPWTFGKTKPVELPVTPQAIVEDIRYNLVPHPSMELPSGATSVVARNFNPNPSVETDTTGWAGISRMVSGDNVAPYRTSARSTDIAAVGAASFLVRVLGDGSTAAGGRSVIAATTPLTSISALSSTTRMSFSTWATLMSIVGSGNVLHSLTAEVQWYGPLVLIDSVPLDADGDFNGMIFTGKGLQIPSGATRVQIEVAGEVTWASSATPSQNSDIRLYVDAAAYMVP